MPGVLGLLPLPYGCGCTTSPRIPLAVYNVADTSCLEDLQLHRDDGGDLHDHTYLSTKFWPSLEPGWAVMAHRRTDQEKVTLYYPAMVLRVFFPRNAAKLWNPPSHIP